MIQPNDDVPLHSGSDSEDGDKGMHLRNILEYWKTLWSIAWGTAGKAKAEEEMEMTPRSPALMT